MDSVLCVVVGALTDGLFLIKHVDNILGGTEEAIFVACVSERTRSAVPICRVISSTRLTTDVTTSGASTTGMSRQVLRFTTLGAHASMEDSVVGSEIIPLTKKLFLSTTVMDGLIFSSTDCSIPISIDTRRDEGQRGLCGSMSVHSYSQDSTSLGSCISTLTIDTGRNLTHRR